MSVQAEHLQALAALTRAMASAGADWYLFGAQAVVLYGVPRATADLDATVCADPTSYVQLAAALAAEGIEPRIEFAAELLNRARVLLLHHQPTSVPIDLVFAGTGLEQEFAAGVRRLELPVGTVPVIAPADLVVAKILAGRPKDLDDVRGIFATCPGEVDLDRARGFLALLEAALDRRDLLSQLEALAES